KNESEAATNSDGTKINNKTVPVKVTDNDDEIEFKENPGSPICAHVYSKPSCTKPKTCTKCGKTEGKPNGHSYSDATCTKPKTCSECGFQKGEALSHNYVLGECTVCGDYNPSYCPKLYFTGDMTGMTNKNDVRNITFEYRSRGQILNGAAKIKIQGSSSTAYEKKNYTINFYENNNYSKKMGVNVGWGAQDEYCLKANWIDKTHSRNVVTAKLVGEMQRKYGLLQSSPNNGAIDGFPIEVYINGTFHGVYTMNIPKDDWQFNMDKNNPNHIVICGEKWANAVYFKEIPTDFSVWSIEVGEENAATLQKIQRLVRFVKDSSDAEFKANFNQYLNLDATLNYYIMMNFAYMPDNTGKNMLLATYDGNVWYPSLYDLDTTWGADWKGQNLYDYKNSLISPGTSWLWKRMETLYKKEIAARYFELRKDVLDANHIMNLFTNFYNSIPKEALDRETAKWDTAQHPIPGYDISQIKDYLNSIIPQLDAKYGAWR
ncbi:MAG: CotH kinase family protein, partial [bacterium]|nr:CotH kinase family protein [bacterium]